MDLEDGEIICKKCEGTGKTIFTEQRGKGFYPIKIQCTRCKGEGKLDWIENLVGMKSIIHEGFISDDVQWERVSWRKLRGYGYFHKESSLKNSSTEIKALVNPVYKKKLERNVAYKLHKG